MGALGADEACQCLAELGEQGASCCQPAASSAEFKDLGIKWEYVTNPKSGVIVQTSDMCTQPSVLWAQKMHLEVTFLNERALPSH